MTRTLTSRFFLSLSILMTMALTGCRYFLIDKDPSINGASTEDSSDYFIRTIIREGNLAFSTQNFLRGNLLTEDLKKKPENLLRSLQGKYMESGDPQYLEYIADICYNTAENENSDGRAASYYLTAALFSYINLFFPQKGQPDAKGSRKGKYDPSVCQCVMRYNTSLYKLFEYLKENKLLLRDAYEMETATGIRVRFNCPINRLSFPLTSYREFTPCAKFNIENMEMVSQTFGIGLPLIAVIGDKTLYKSIKMPDFFPQPATMLLNFFKSKDFSIDGGIMDAQIIFFDPCKVNDVQIADEVVPLFQDYSTPIAAMSTYMPEPHSMLRTFFNPYVDRESNGLYMLENYSKNQIPVVFVHGLMSSPMTWMRMINMLNSYPKIRNNYQFWLFKYSSTDSIFASARDLYNALNAAKKELTDRGELSHDDFNKMVIVGHSMGGLLTRLVLLDDEDTFINLYGSSTFGKDWEKVRKQISPQIQKLRSQEHTNADFIKRVVFMAVPHRGAELADWKIVKALSGLIDLPDNVAGTFQYRLEKMFLTNGSAEENKIVHDFSLSGLSYLNPENEVLKVLQITPFASGLPIHSIIGNIDAKDEPSGTDGVVSYASSHLDGVKSERVVKSKHNVQKTPDTIMELLRILREHAIENGRDGDNASTPMKIPLDTPLTENGTPQVK